MSKKIIKMQIEKTESDVTERSEIEILQEQLFLANQKQLETISDEIISIEKKHNISVGIQLDATKMADIFRYMLTNNKTMVSLKFEIWKNP